MEYSTEESNSEDQLLITSEKQPLSRMQLALLCFLRLLEPLSFTQIFPYINEFMRDLNVTTDPSKIGFYSGLIESSFAVCQLMSIYPWGFMSDMIGRRPVILAGTVGLAISTILFGLSQNFQSALAARALGGLFSGNVAVIPSVLCEITDRSNQSFVFPFFGLWWPIGAIIGPLIGGAFSNPATRYPRLFHYEFFRAYPYFLPCFVVFSVTAVCIFFTFFFLQESLHRIPVLDVITTATTPTTTTAYNGVSQRKPDGVYQPQNSLELFSVPIIRAICLSGCALSFISTSFDVVFVLFCFSPIDLGGLGFSISEIGVALAISGTIAALLQLFFMPVLLCRFDHARMYHFCVKIWPCTFIILPSLNILARLHVDQGTGHLDASIAPIIWTLIAMISCLARVGFLGYSINMLLVKEYSPRPSLLGSTNALVQFFICLSRAVSPTFISLTFTASTDLKIFGGYTWVVIMVLICLGSCSLSQKIVTETDKLRHS
ncbi:major facilitator superfamily multidrug-resistance, DHA1 sub-family [Collybia nuda]|uniref:Major facilitator superfamily multidrug-resistance, DHA1 sub-family n=1 Tax=Collybia nuda TaxID=64659 RepID=A0A9P6CF40_9AGAR|nr:major facilitator superfamily multidrug-resistance, DHA1 sub-family [Collybia nuda]